MIIPPRIAMAMVGETESRDSQLYVPLFFHARLRQASTHLRRLSIAGSGPKESCLIYSTRGYGASTTLESLVHACVFKRGSFLQNINLVCLKSDILEA